MRTIIALVLVTLTACFAHGNASDTVRFVDAGAICQPAFDGKDFASARCALSSGAKVYCTASAQGFACTVLNGSAPPQPTPPNAPQHSAPAPAVDDPTKPKPSTMPAGKVP